MKIHNKKDQYVKQEILTGGVGANNIKFDLQPVAARILKPIDKKSKILLTMKSIGGA